MSIDDSHAKLIQAARKLDLHWNEMKNIWKDDNCRQFENDYILPLQAEIKKTSQAMERIATLIDRLRRECQ